MTLRQPLASATWHSRSCTPDWSTEARRFPRTACGSRTVAYPRIPYATGPEDAKQCVSARIAEGADHLRLIYDDGSGAMLNLPTLDSPTVRALTDEAHAHGLTVVGHVSTAAGAVKVVE